MLRSKEPLRNGEIQTTDTPPLDTSSRRLTAPARPAAKVLIAASSDESGGTRTGAGKIAASRPGLPRCSFPLLGPSEAFTFFFLTSAATFSSEGTPNRRQKFQLHGVFIYLFSFFFLLLSLSSPVTRCPIGKKTGTDAMLSVPPLPPSTDNLTGEIDAMMIFLYAAARPHVSSPWDDDFAILDGDNKKQNKN